MWRSDTQQSDAVRPHLSISSRVAEGRHGLSVHVARCILSPRAQRVQGKRRIQRTVEEPPWELAGLTVVHDHRVFGLERIERERRDMP
jgi:hypothetical protein